MSGSPPLSLSTTIEVSGEAYVGHKTSAEAPGADDRPVFRCDLPLPTPDEMADDGGAAALIARSVKLKT